MFTRSSPFPLPYRSRFNKLSCGSYLSCITTTSNYIPPTNKQGRPDAMNVSSPHHVDHTESASYQSGGRVIITATTDTENHVMVDITGIKDAPLIRKRIFSTLRIPSKEHDYCSIYRTEPGSGALGDPVDDFLLMIYCEVWADGKGTLLFLVQRNSQTLTSYLPSS